MRSGYIIKESFRGFSSAKLSTLASVITITLSLILITIYFTLSVNSNKWIKFIRDKVELEVFLQDGYTNEGLDSLREQIRRIGGVKQIDFISKDEAVKIFEKEFGREMLEVLDANPLPASFKVSLYDEYKTNERIGKISDELSKNPLVGDITFPKKSLDMIESSSSAFLSLNLVILIIVTLSSLFLVSNTIRLVITSKRKNILTLRLLGATKSFIRTPFIIEGFIQGLCGGLLAVIVLYLLYKILSFDNEIIIDFVSWYNLFMLLLAGIALGIIGSTLSVRRFLKEPVHK